MVYKLQMSFLLMKVLFLYNSWVEMFLFLSHTKITFNINLIKFYGFFPVIFLEAKNVCICCVREYSGVVFGFFFLSWFVSFVLEYKDQNWSLACTGPGVYQWSTPPAQKQRSHACGTDFPRSQFKPRAIF